MLSPTRSERIIVRDFSDRNGWSVDKTNYADEAEDVDVFTLQHAAWCKKTNSVHTHTHTHRFRHSVLFFFWRKIQTFSDTVIQRVICSSVTRELGWPKENKSDEDIGEDLHIPCVSWSQTPGPWGNSYLFGSIWDIQFAPMFCGCQAPPHHHKLAKLQGKI